MSPSETKAAVLKAIRSGAPQRKGPLARRLGVGQDAIVDAFDAIQAEGKISIIRVYGPEGFVMLDRASKKAA